MLIHHDSNAPQRPILFFLHDLESSSARQHAQSCSKKSWHSCSMLNKILDAYIKAHRVLPEFIGSSGEQFSQTVWSDPLQNIRKLIQHAWIVAGCLFDDTGTLKEGYLIFLSAWEGKQARYHVQIHSKNSQHSYNMLNELLAAFLKAGRSSGSNLGFYRSLWRVVHSGSKIRSTQKNQDTCSTCSNNCWVLVWQHWDPQGGLHDLFEHFEG